MLSLVSLCAAAAGGHRLPEEAAGGEHRLPEEEGARELLQLHHSYIQTCSPPAPALCQWSVFIGFAWLFIRV